MTSLATFTAIRAMILDAVDQTIFLPENIKQAFQPAIGGNFIAYWLLPAKKTSVTTVNTYNYAPLTQLGTRTNTMLFESLIQIDLYSDNSYIANDSATILYQYLTAFAPDYLYTNFNGMSIGEVDNIVNNTQTGDKGTYLYRYTVRFSMFIHQQIIKAQDFVEVEIVPVFIN